MKYFFRLTELFFIGRTHISINSKYLHRTFQFERSLKSRMTNTNKNHDLLTNSAIFDETLSGPTIVRINYSYLATHFIHTMSYTLSIYYRYQEKRTKTHILYENFYVDVFFLYILHLYRIRVEN